MIRMRSHLVRCIHRALCALLTAAPQAYDELSDSSKRDPYDRRLWGVRAAQGQGTPVAAGTSGRGRRGPPGAGSSGGYGGSSGGYGGGAGGSSQAGPDSSGENAVGQRARARSGLTRHTGDHGL